MPSSIKFPRVGVAVRVGVAPNQHFVCQFVKMEFGFPTDAAAHASEDAFTQVGSLRLVAVVEGRFQKLHPEGLFLASKIEVLTLHAPLAGTDIVEHPRHRSAVVQYHFVDLSGGVEGGAILVKVHGAGLVHINVPFRDIIVPPVLVDVVPLHLRGGVPCGAA